MKREIAAKNHSYCMITNSYYDKNLPNYSIQSLISVPSQSVIYFVLNEKDSLTNHLFGFVRPFKETELIHCNYYDYYVNIFTEIMETLVENYNFFSNISNSMNLYLHMLNYIYEKAFGITCKSSKEFLILLFEHQINPICYSVIEKLSKIPTYSKNNALKEISRNLSLHIELKKKELTELQDELLNMYENNKLELNYWYEIIKKNKNSIDKLKLLVENTKGSLKEMIIYHLKTLINHIS